MKSFNYGNPILTDWETDKNGNKISIAVENESHTVIGSKAVLNGLPDETFRVKIVGMNEVGISDEIADKTQYKVDYGRTGTIYFHEDLEAKRILVEKYYSRGVVYYPASRIYTKADNLGNVIETLDANLEGINNIQATIGDLVEEGEAIINSMQEKMYTATSLDDKIHETLKSAEVRLNDVVRVKTRLDKTIEDGTELSRQLKDDLDIIDEKVHSFDKQIDEINEAVQKGLDASDIILEALENTDALIGKLDRSFEKGSSLAKTMAETMGEFELKIADMNKQIRTANQIIENGKAVAEDIKKRIVKVSILLEDMEDKVRISTNANLELIDTIREAKEIDAILKETISNAKIVLSLLKDKIENAKALGLSLENDLSMGEDLIEKFENTLKSVEDTSQNVLDTVNRGNNLAEELTLINDTASRTSISLSDLVKEGQTVDDSIQKQNDLASANIGEIKSNIDLAKSIESSLLGSIEDAEDRRTDLNQAIDNSIDEYNKLNYEIVSGKEIISSLEQSNLETKKTIDEGKNTKLELDSSIEKTLLSLNDLEKAKEQSEKQIVLATNSNKELKETIDSSDNTSSTLKKVVDLGEELKDELGTIIAGTDFEELTGKVNNKVDKVEGKGLSTNDFTDKDKAKLLEIDKKANKDELPKNLSDLKIDIEIGKNYDDPINDLKNLKVDKVEGKELSSNDFTDEDKEAIKLIGNKVDKETGKGLSTNDFTTADKIEVQKIKDKVDKIDGKGLSTNDFTDLYKAKIDEIDDKVSIEDMNSGLNSKVDKVEGKHLSSNDFTDDHKFEISKIKNKVDVKDIKALTKDKVDKVEGKGLSTNDYTDEDKKKVQTIDDKADKLDLKNIKHIHLGTTPPSDTSVLWLDEGEGQFGDNLLGDLSENMVDLESKVRTISEKVSVLEVDKDAENDCNSQIKRVDKTILKNSNKISQLEDMVANIEPSSRSSTIVIANYNSSPNSQKGADVVVGEKEDASKVINEAVSSLDGVGGEIRLMEGKYNLESSVSVSIDGVHLVGIPNATILILSDKWQPNASFEHPNSIMEIGGNQSYASVSNIVIDGKNSSNSRGFNCLGNAVVNNCVAKDVNGYGFACFNKAELYGCISKQATQGGFVCGEFGVLKNCSSENAIKDGFICGGKSIVVNCMSKNSKDYGFYCPSFFKGICSNNISVGDSFSDDTSDIAIIENNLIYKGE